MTTLKRLNNNQIDKLQPFFVNRTDKTRACIYLMAAGLRPTDISDLKGADIIDIANQRLPTIIKQIFETLSISVLDDSLHDQYFFATPSGRRYTSAFISKILKDACVCVGVPYRGYHQFTRHIKSDD